MTDVARPHSGFAGDSLRRRARVLLVDPLPDTRRAAQAALRLDGYEVTSVGGAAAAVGLCARVAFDLVVTDLALYDGGGSKILAAARQANQAGTTTGVAVLPFCAAPEPADQGESVAREAGFGECVRRPVSLDQLSQAAWRALANWRASN